MENKQLYEKIGNEYKQFVPIADILSIIDKSTGMSAKDLFNTFNHIKLDWKGDVTNTRLSVPVQLRHNGLYITYNDGNGIITEYYIGSSMNAAANSVWQKDEYWLNTSQAAGLADEEDITERNSKLSFKDREYKPSNFSGLGKVILRKNFTEVGTSVKNVLTQDAINKSNTIYEIRYDFDLNGAEITIPEGCVLDFQGGSLSNGFCVFNNTRINANNESLKNIKFKGVVENPCNPVWFGFGNKDARTNYIILSNLYNGILSNNLNSVTWEDYQGEIIEINQPINDNPIEIPFYNDFCGLTMILVREEGGGEAGAYSSLFLVKNYNILKSIDGLDENLDTGIFSSVDEFKNKNILLIVKDENPWIQRIGYDYLNYREDTILIENGISKNSPIYSYNDGESSPVYNYVEYNDKSVVFKNINIIKKENNKGIFNLVRFENLYGIYVTNINIDTKKSNAEIEGDRCLLFNHCANIEIKNCNIKGNHGYKGHGYIFRFEWCYKAFLDNLNETFDGWHMFGSQGVDNFEFHNIVTKNIDVHFYGKDILVDNCTLYYYGVSTKITGTLKVSNSTFYSACIGSQDASYNFAEKLDIYVDNCKFHYGRHNTRYTAIKAVQLNSSAKVSEHNFRSVLKKAYIPNIYANNIVVDGVKEGRDVYYLVEIYPNIDASNDTLRIDLQNIVFDVPEINILLGNGCYKANHITINIKDVNIINKEIKSVYINNVEFEGYVDICFDNYNNNIKETRLIIGENNKANITYNNCSMHLPYYSKVTKNNIIINHKNCKFDLLNYGETLEIIYSPAKFIMFDNCYFITHNKNYYIKHTGDTYLRFINCLKDVETHLLHYGIDSPYELMNCEYIYSADSEEELHIDHVQLLNEPFYNKWWRAVKFSSNYYTIPFLSVLCGQDSLPIQNLKPMVNYLSPGNYIGETAYNTYRNKPCYWNGEQWLDSDGAPSEVNRIGGTNEFPSVDNIPTGFMYYDVNRRTPCYKYKDGWLNSNGVNVSFNNFGTFENVPIHTSDWEVSFGFAYFCTDRQTTEGGATGIMIYHKGNNVWVDALGRVIK